MRTLAFQALYLRTMTVETIAHDTAYGLRTLLTGRCQDNHTPWQCQPSRMQTNCLKQGDIMFLNINAHPGSKPKSFGELGQLSRARVILSEFKYDKGTEIYGEAEPSEYIYQVVEGAVRSHKLLSDGRRQIGAFHLIGDI